MALLEDVLAYLVGHYPKPSELSNARLTKMVYLADWKHSIEHGRQITDIHWLFDHYGPFVRDVVNAARRHPALFSMHETVTGWGNPKTVIGLADPHYRPASITPDEQDSLDHVLRTTPDLGFDAFIRLVYSTYPILKSERYSRLDLPALAAEYQREMHPAF